jgi:hypothetical protein
MIAAASGWFIERYGHARAAEMLYRAADECIAAYNGAREIKILPVEAVPIERKRLSRDTSALILGAFSCGLLWATPFIGRLIARLIE